MLVRQLPVLLNHVDPAIQLSDNQFGSKLAVATGTHKTTLTKGNGSAYPKHIDNIGLPDKRKLTCILYLNNNWQQHHGGELCLYTKEGQQEIAPKGDTFVTFYSDLVVHSVNENKCTIPEDDRYALTTWLMTNNTNIISDKTSPLYPLAQHHFNINKK